MKKRNSTDLAMETQDQLKTLEETVHLKVLKLMHFSNSNVKLCDPCFILPIPKHDQNLYSSSGLGSYTFLHFLMCC